MRARVCTGCLLLALAACDQDYSFRLQARITARGAPVEGAWIVPLSGSPPVDGIPLRTGADGTASGEFRAFNHVPSGESLVVYHPGHPLSIVLPGREIRPRHRGWRFRRRDDATLELDLARPQPDVRAPLTCAGDSCELTAPPSIGVSCNEYVLQLSPAAVQVSSGGGLRPLPSGAGKVRLVFALPAKVSGTLAAVAICAAESQPLQAVIGESR